VLGLREGSLSLVKLQASVFDLSIELFALQNAALYAEFTVYNMYADKRSWDILYLKTKIDQLFLSFD